ncbi:MAG: hypothetical protein E6968_13715 [Peptostreptococcaceae bacterium]|uniref:hypothetical protein n=1 Tax=Peptostreptococcus anaerobius TaxID=1261 RepID=UPI0005872ACF|nr:hypothetical protein [Peptostreptococcus anaerobius]KXB70334.1 hypothetical protein HMPREF3183_01239 [Peptostreptococcus anaerobius]MDU1255252.1 hypothetical protein [Peptostreptococcaceae bacterium]
MQKMYEKFFLVEEMYYRSSDIRCFIYLLSIFPIFVILKECYFYSGDNNLYSYLVVSLISYFTSSLFLKETIIKKINIINVFFSVLLYTIIIFLPLLLSVVGILSDPVGSFIDIISFVLPYVSIFLFVKFSKKYLIYKSNRCER